MSPKRSLRLIRRSSSTRTVATTIEPALQGRLTISHTNIDSVQSFIGIDISKGRLDVHVRPSAIAFSVPRDPGGLANLLEHLLPLVPKLIVLEATGGFEIIVAAATAGAGLALAIVNPRQICDFARACGQLAKTDALDAMR